MRLFFFILLCTLSTQSFGQARVTAALDSTRILIGDQLNLYLRVPKADGVSNPSSNLNALQTAEGIEIVETGTWDTLNVRGTRALQQKIVLTSFDSGYYFIPQIPISFSQNGKNVTQSTPQLAFMVNTIETNPEMVAPIKNIIAEPMRFEDLIPFLLTILALVLIGYGIYYYLRKRKKEEAPPPPEVIIPPHEIAFDKLNVLKGKELWQKGEVKAYQSELTYIVREYLENRYDIQALESTSDEIIKDLKKNAEISEDHRMNLREMFTMADLVKFAKAKPPENVNEKLMTYAENFVEKTKKIIVEVATTEKE